MHKNITTIERFINNQQYEVPDASGSLTHLLQDIALAGKLISSHTNRAGLGDLLGATGDKNVQGEYQQKLDIYSHDTMFNFTAHTGRMGAMVSEEDENILHASEDGKYILLVDPLDGSSNIDVNVSVGTIFAIYRKKSNGRVTIDDVLQPGNQIVAAGYIVYASSTMMVYTAGKGVHGFTLDPSIGEFFLSHENIRIPDPGKYFSANLGRYSGWSPGAKKFTSWLQGGDDSGLDMSLRYIGSMVGDVHRTLLMGGTFYYPADKTSPSGKLRLLYEAIPMAFILEQAGGMATDGSRRILDIQPEKMHQRTPVFLGSNTLVGKANDYIKELG